MAEAVDGDVDAEGIHREIEFSFTTKTE